MGINNLVKKNTEPLIEVKNTVSPVKTEADIA